MARPGEVVQRAPEGAEHGAGAALQRLQEALPLAKGQQQAAPPQLQQPFPSAPPPAPPTPEPPPISGDVSGGYDEQLFSQSHRPGEPITAGAPFGPGANFIPQAGEDDHTFMLRVADQLGRAPTTQRVRLLAERIRLGE